MQLRHFALGVVAALALAPQANAGDAVVADEWEQQQAVGACDAYGAGFAKLPGTDTCARVSGEVRYEKRFSNSGRQSGGGMTLDFETRSD